MDRSLTCRHQFPDNSRCQNPPVAGHAWCPVHLSEHADPEKKKNKGGRPRKHPRREDNPTPPAPQQDDPNAPVPEYDEMIASAKQQFRRLQLSGGPFGIKDQCELAKAIRSLEEAKIRSNPAKRNLVTVRAVLPEPTPEVADELARRGVAWVRMKAIPAERYLEAAREGKQ